MRIWEVVIDINLMGLWFKFGNFEKLGFLGWLDSDNLGWNDDRDITCSRSKSRICCRLSCVQWLTEIFEAVSFQLWSTLDLTLVLNYIVCLVLSHCNFFKSSRIHMHSSEFYSRWWRKSCVAMSGDCKLSWRWRNPGETGGSHNARVNEEVHTLQDEFTLLFTE